MTFTRDAAIWWLLFIAAAGGLVLKHWDKVVVACAGGNTPEAWHARVDFLVVFCAGVALYLRMSPLPLSWSNPLAVDKMTAGTAVNPITSKPLN